MDAFKDIPKETLAAAVAAAVIGVAALAQGGGGKTEAAAPKKAEEPEPEPEPIDVSIPYDAAARLAFAEMSSEEADEEKFAKFKQLYEKKTVAEVTAKKAARDLATLA